jgi:hypothetical protein
MLDSWLTPALTSFSKLVSSSNVCSSIESEKLLSKKKGFNLFKVDLKGGGKVLEMLSHFAYE